jgi:hypothetical protein
MVKNETLGIYFSFNPKINAEVFLKKGLNEIYIYIYV